MHICRHMASSGKLLTYRTVEGSSPKQYGILLHGFGADAEDLLPLTEVLDPDRRLTWLVPEAPVSFQDYGFPGGRAWFPGSVQELSQALFGGYFSKLGALDPPGLHNGAVLLRNTFRGVASDGELSVLAGFSQGAMVATDAVLTGVLQPAALLLFSGTVIAHERWRAAVPPVSPSLFQSHGHDDPILPYSGAEALYELLRAKGFPTRFHGFPGGHMIPPEVVAEAAEVLNKLG